MPEHRKVPHVKLWDGYIVLECGCGVAILYPGHPDDHTVTICDACGRSYECVEPSEVPTC